MKYTHLAERFMAICDVRRDEPMRAHTTFRIGGPADVFCLPASIDSFVEAVKAARDMGAPVFILGGGSNLLVRDGGIRGVVVSSAGLNQISELDGCTIEAGCGVVLARLAAFTRDLSLTGLEFAQGIPGTVGGGVAMNAGAYGGDISGVVLETDYLDRDCSLKTLRGGEHNFGYRRSFFTDNPDTAVLKTRFRFQRGDAAAITKTMSEYRERRRTMQPLEYPSAGSAFKRPQGMFAGKLISEAGLRGYAVGGAQVSEKHAGFVVNTGGATAADVVCLLEHIRQRVHEVHGVWLEQEIRVVGE